MRKPLHIGIAGPITLTALRGVLNKFEPAWPKGLGGVPVNHLIIALIKLGYKVSVYSSSPDVSESAPFQYHQDNLSIYIGPYRKSAKSRMLDLFYVERDYIRKIVGKTKPDVIHAHWQYEWAWGAINSGVPTLVTCHDAPLKVLQVERDLYRLVRAFIAAYVLRKAKFLTTVSPYCKRELRWFSTKNIDIIPNFEPEFVFNLYTEDRSIRSPLKIVMINNGFTSRKNVETGIQTFLEYKRAHVDVELHLFGHDFGEGEAAQKWCLANQIDFSDISFYGAIPFEQLMLKLTNMDILLHTSLEESFGMILVEAMAMGIPVIAGAEAGGPPWILKDGGGILVNVNDKTSILSAIDNIVVNYTHYSNEARRIAQNSFSEKAVVDKYIELYEKIAVS